MRTVEVQEYYDASNERVSEILEPRRILEWEGTYTSLTTENNSAPVRITAKNDQYILKLEFQEIKNGYIYEQVGCEGPFEDMKTEIIYKESYPVKVCARSHFTFGLPFQRFTDRIGGWNREVELSRLLFGLATHLSSNHENYSKL